MIALAGHKYENLTNLRHIASFHDKLLQSSWVAGGYSKWGHGYISIFMFLCSISCIWCISSICVFKLLLHFPSLKWTDDQGGGGTRSYFIRKYLWSRSSLRNIWEIIYKRQVFEKSSFKRIPGKTGRYCIWNNWLLISTNCRTLFCRNWY